MKNYYKLLSNKLIFLCVIYVFLFSIISYSASLIYTKKTLTKNEQKRAEQLVSNLNDFLTYSIDITYTLSTNNPFVSFAQNNTIDSYDNFYNIQDIQSQLSAFIFQNSSYKSIAIVNPHTNQIITSGGTESLTYFIENQNLSSETIGETLKNMQNNNEDNITLEISQNNTSSHIVAAISHQTNRNNPVIFLMLYDFETLFNSLPESALNCIINVNMNRGSINFAYNEHSGLAASFSDINMFGYKLIAQAESPSYYFKNISCSLYVPYFQYLINLNSFLLLLVLLVLGLFFVGIIFAKRNVAKMYRPVQNLLNNVPTDSIKNTAGEFEALEKHLSYLSSQKSIMSDIITNNKKQLSEKFLLQLITSPVSKVQLREGMTTYGFNNFVLPLQLFIVTYRNFFELMEILSIDGLNEVRNSIHEYFNTTYKSSEFFRLIDIDQQTMVILTHVNDSESFAHSLKKSILTIEMLFDIDLVVFAGTVAESWNELSSSYTSALYLKNKCVISPEQKIIISSKDAQIKQIIEYSQDTENKLINSVLSGNLNTAVETANYIVDTNMNEAIMTHSNHSQFITMVYSSLIKILSQINKTEAEIFGDTKLYLELVGSSDPETLKLTLTGIISRLISNIQNEQKDITDSISNRMLSYIHENYAHCDISLFSLADHLNLSQSYTSRFFKAQTGENFKDYLTDYRMEKAVEMMKMSPETKMTDIASAVGCTPKTFTRAFTKKYGIAPSNYIRKSDD